MAFQELEVSQGCRHLLLVVVPESREKGRDWAVLMLADVALPSKWCCGEDLGAKQAQTLGCVEGG